MRTLEESRGEFNENMQNYIAMIIRTERRPFPNEFFMDYDLNSPNSRVYYTPPSQVGSRSPMGVQPGIEREELIPEIESNKKYLICDDFCEEGRTFDIAMLRLSERGVSIDNVWCISRAGNWDFKIGTMLLDKGIEWKKYKLKRDELRR